MTSTSPSSGSTKISQFPAASAFSNADTFPITQSGVTRAGTPALMAAFIGAQAVVNIAVLKAMTSQSANALVRTAGYYSAGDGGGSLYFWNSSDATADNGGTVIAPNAGTGRWNMVIAENTINALQFGAKFDGATDDTAAINAWTVAIRGGKIRGLMPAGTAKMTSSWNCADATGTGTNLGLWIEGSGGKSIIRFQYAVTNTQVGWDLTGSAYGVFKDFEVLGGTSTANCPRATVLQSGGNVAAALLFSGLHYFQNVVMAGYGDFVILNQGAEQIDYDNCEAYGYSTAGTAAVFCYVAAGSATLLASPNATVYTPIVSMTQVNWHGAKAVMAPYGARNVLVHYSAAGGVENLRHDGFLSYHSNTANPLVLFGDDAAALAGTTMQHCGMDDSIVEASGTTGHVVVAKITVSTHGDWIFRGRCSSGVALTDIQFQFTSDPYSGLIVWVPNDSGGGWAGTSIVSAPSGGGLTMQFSIPIRDAQGLITTTDRNMVSGYHNLAFIMQGTDWLKLGSPINTGPALDNQFNVTSVTRGGARVSVSSDGINAVRTTQGVTGGGATAIMDLPGYGQLVAVTGVSGGDVFADLVWCSSTAFTVLVSQTAQGTPAGRAYSIAGGQLKLVMAASAYNIQATCTGYGTQA